LRFYIHIYGESRNRGTRRGRSKEREREGVRERGRRGDGKVNF
jgi:hypothetical protein